MVYSLRGASVRAGVGLVLGALCAGAAGQPVVFTVDPDRSSMEVTITLQTVLGDRTDSDSSAMGGFLYAGADDYGAPGSVVLYDFGLLLAETLEFEWSYGFLGSADATLTGGGLVDAAPGTPKGPVPVTGGSFTVVGVPTQAVGVAVANYDLLTGDGQSVVDLTTLPPEIGSFPGSIVVTGTTIEVTSTVSFSGTIPLFEGAEAVVAGSGTLVATATAPVCSADLAPPAGVFNFFDVSAFLAAYAALDPAADFRPDGVWNFFDVSAFLSAYNAGCD